MLRTKFVLGLAVMLALAACSKTPTEGAPAPAASNAVQEEEVTNENVHVQDPTPPPADPTQQASILASHIASRPECEQFLQPLAAASKAAPGSLDSMIDMTDIMQRAQEAGCTRK